VHGTTVATNAILQQRGSRLGIVMTKGFRDTLIIGRGHREELYNLEVDALEPLFLAPRRRLAEVSERIAADGSVVSALDEVGLVETVGDLIANESIEAVVICLLHAYANPAHELRAKAVLGEAFPELPVTISSRVLPKAGEYERLVVSAFDAYVSLEVSGYLGRLQRGLDGRGFAAPLQVMQSNGRISGVHNVIQHPVRTVMSGLAAGVIGASRVAETAGYPNAISLDMGGTSADIAVITDAKPTVVTNGKFDKYPLSVPMVDVNTIGAGGSSVAHLNEGSLRVGPRSAGAKPGPACYQRGGTEPTVTDASFVLGLLDPETFAGSIDIDIDCARRAIDEAVGTPLNMRTEDAALGIHEIVNANMADALRLASIARGYDPREFVLVACGGAGPVHAGRLAEELGIPTVLVPPTPGVLSAQGLLYAPIEHDATGHLRVEATEESLEEIGAAFRALDEWCAERMMEDGIASEQASVGHRVEARYVGQAHSLFVPIGLDMNAEGVIADVVAKFHGEHLRLYTYARESASVEITAVHATHSFTVPGASHGAAPWTVQSDPDHPQQRLCLFDRADGWVETPVFQRVNLPVGFKTPSPAIIEQADSTTVVYPGQRAHVDEHFNIILELA
jgi:N-methylhydantoinase A/oxoprolinase/acetone carboxylase beta subunit